MGMKTTSHVTEIPAAFPEEAAAHFERLLALETDCWDVHEAMKDGAPDFVLLHVNGDRAGFDSGHVPGATFMHHSTSTRRPWRPTRRPRCSWSTARGRTATAPTGPRPGWRGSGGRSRR